MRKNFEKEINNAKHKATIVPIDFETSSHFLRTFEQKYYFCTLKITM